MPKLGGAENVTEPLPEEEVRATTKSGVVRNRVWSLGGGAADDEEGDGAEAEESPARGQGGHA